MAVYARLLGPRSPITNNDTWHNSAGGVITVGASSTLDLGGHFFIADLGTINRDASATVNLLGFLNNTSTTLALTSSTGSWNLVGGEILNGIITTSGSAVLAGNTAGDVLDGVTLNGTLNFEWRRQRQRPDHSGWPDPQWRHQRDEFRRVELQ